MLIHIEWVDLCWKSTLIDKMSRLFKNTMVLSTPKEYLPREDSKEAREKIWKFYIQRLKEVEKLLDDNPDCHIILDRFFFSELTYGKVMRWYDSKDMEEYQREVFDLIKQINEKHWYALIYLSDKTEDIRNRYLEKGDDYVKDKKHYHNLKVSYGKWINAWEQIFKVVKINVFKDKDYWNRIIEEVLLSDYVYTRDGKY